MNEMSRIHEMYGIKTLFFVGHCNLICVVIKPRICLRVMYGCGVSHARCFLVVNMHAKCIVVTVGQRTGFRLFS